VSQENVELVRGLFAELATAIRLEEVEQRLSDEVLTEFLDPEVEWIPIAQSLLAVDSYRGYEALRGFFTEFLSMVDEYMVEPQEFFDAGDQVAVVYRTVGRTHDVDVDATWSSLCAIRDGRIVRVQNFPSRGGALEAAGLRE
jgi:ketosteroid isomerase-like protein